MKKRVRIFSFLFLAIISFNSCRKENAFPSADFNYTGDDAQSPAVITFTNTSSNASSYLWQFDDSTTSTETDPVRTFQSGNHTVVLNAIGNGYTSTQAKTFYITGPVTDFSFTGESLKAPCEVTFTNSSLSASQWLWDFGDGQTSTLKDPSHVFTSGNNFKVKLTATGAIGSSSVTKTVSILNAPASCIIHQIFIGICPTTDSTGAAWDVGGAPDLYITVETASGTVLYDGSAIYINNHNPPQWLNIMPAITIPNADWNMPLRFKIWDHDDVDPDDLMTYGDLIITDNATLTNYYPQDIGLNCPANSALFIGVDWQ